MAITHDDCHVPIYTLCALVSVLLTGQNGKYGRDSAETAASQKFTQKRIAPRPWLR